MERIPVRKPVKTPLKAADMMVRDVISITGAETLRDAIETFQRHHVRQVPVIEDGTLVGILSDRDVKRATPSPLSGGGMADYDRVVDSTRVAQLMTRNPYSVTPTTPLRDVVKALHDSKHGAIPVVEGERLVGLVTANDMLGYLLSLMPE